MSGRLITSRAPSARLRLARAVCAPLPPFVAQAVRRAIYPLPTARQESIEFTVTSLTGSPFTGTTLDFVAYPVAVHGYFNWRNLAIARAVCSDGDVIFEIGANVGSETIGYSDIVGASGAVYAFEPFPPNLERLRVNAGQTKLGNVEVMPFAVSDEEGTVRFAAPKPDNSGCGYVLDADEQSASQQPASDVVEVRRTTLDTLVADSVRPPQLIVMDAEGHEGSILRGAETLLAAHQPVIVLEVRASLLARTGTSPQQMADQLRRLGYELFAITRFRLTPIDQQQDAVAEATDWVAIPSTRSNAVKQIERMVRRCGLMPCVRPLNPLRLS
jgi:FkbM family methyltransferase